MRGSHCVPLHTVDYAPSIKSQLGSRNEHESPMWYMFGHVSARILSNLHPLKENCNQIPQVVRNSSGGEGFKFDLKEVLGTLTALR